MAARIYDILSNMVSVKRALNVFDLMLLQQLTRGADINALSFDQTLDVVRGLIAQLNNSGGTIGNTIVNNSTGVNYTAILGETVEVSLQNELGITNNTVLLRDIELLLLPLEMGGADKGNGTVLQRLIQLPQEYMLHAVFSVSDFASSISNDKKIKIRNVSELSTAANDEEFILFLTPTLAFIFLESPFDDDMGDPIAVKIDLVQGEVRGLDASERLGLAELVGYINITDVLEE